MRLKIMTLKESENNSDYLVYNNLVNYNIIDQQSRSAVCQVKGRLHEALSGEEYPQS